MFYTKIKAINNTSTAIITNGEVITSSSSYTFDWNDQGMVFQVPESNGYVELTSVKNNEKNTTRLKVVTGFYKNEYGNNPSGTLTIEFNKDGTFTLQDTSIENVEIKPNQVVNYPFDATKQDASNWPYPWHLKDKHIDIVESLDKETLHLATEKSSSTSYTNVGLENQWKIDKGCHIHFDILITKLDTPDDGNFLLKLASILDSKGKESLSMQLNRNEKNGENFTYVNQDSQYQTISNLEVQDNVKFYKEGDFLSVDLVIFSDCYAIYENNEYLGGEYSKSSFGESVQINFNPQLQNKNSNLNLYIQNIQVGNPYSSMDSHPISSESKLFSISSYHQEYFTCSIQCEDVIGSIQFDPAGSNESSIKVFNSKTGELLSKKDTSSKGSAYRKPFVDEQFKFICFPIDNESWWFYDVRAKKFLNDGNSVNIFESGDSCTYYSEEISYNGVVYFLGNDKYWRAYDIINDKHYSKFAKLDTGHSISRIYKPIVQGETIVTYLYDTNSGNDYTTVQAWDITNLQEIVPNKKEPVFETKWKNLFRVDGTKPGSVTIKMDNLNVYFWTQSKNIYAVKRDDGTKRWKNENYKSNISNVSVAPLPFNDQFACFITDDGTLKFLDPLTGNEKKHYSVGNHYITDTVEIYPSYKHTATYLKSEPKIIDGHFSFQGIILTNTDGNGNKTAVNNAYSVNLSNGTIETTRINASNSNFSNDYFVNDFGLNSILVLQEDNDNGYDLKSYQFQDYFNNFYFDTAMMADYNDEILRKPTDTFYNVTISLQNDQGVPIPNVIHLSMSKGSTTIYSPALIDYKDGEVELNPDTTIALQPGLDGKVTFKIKAESLHVPAINFWCDFMLPNVQIVFFANQSNVDVLRETNASAISQAKTYDDKDVFVVDQTDQDQQSQILSMIGNSVGGSTLDTSDVDAQLDVNSGNNKLSSYEKLVSKEKREIIREKRKKSLEKQQAILSDQYNDYYPVLSDDFVAFPDYSTDNCLCSLHENYPVVDRAYMTDEQTWTLGQMEVIDDSIVQESALGESHNAEEQKPSLRCVYHKDEDKKILKELERRFAEQTQQEGKEYGFEEFAETLVSDQTSFNSWNWSEADISKTNHQKKSSHIFKKLRVQIVDAAGKIYQFIINTVEQGLAVLTSFFEQVAKSIKDVIQWLSWVFDWDDILTVQDNLANTITNNSILAERLFVEKKDTLATTITNTINTIENKVDNIFGDVERMIAGNSVDDLTEGKRNPRIVTGEGGDNTTNQTNYLFEKFGMGSNEANLSQAHRSYHKNQGKKFKVKDPSNPNYQIINNIIDFHWSKNIEVEGSDDDPTFESIIKEVAIKFWKGLKELAKTLGKDIFKEFKQELIAIQKMFGENVSTVEDFIKTGVISFVDILKTLINLLLQIVEDVAQAMLAFMPMVLKAFREFLYVKVPLPAEILSFWNLISGGKKCNILNFFTLFGAVPLTTVIKLKEGKYGEENPNNLFLKPDGVPIISNNPQAEVSDNNNKNEKEIKRLEMLSNLSYATIASSTFYHVFDFVADCQDMKLIVPPSAKVNYALMGFDLITLMLTFPSWDKAEYDDISSDVWGGDYACWTLGCIHWIGSAVAMGGEKFISLPKSFRDRKIDMVWVIIGSIWDTLYGFCFLIVTMFRIIPWANAEKGDGGNQAFSFWHFFSYGLTEVVKILKLGKVNPVLSTIVLATDTLAGGFDAFAFLKYAIDAEDEIIVLGSA